MITYCPTCGNMLLVEYTTIGNLRYFCETCPYIYELDRPMTKSVPLAKKDVEDVFGGDAAMKNAQKANVACGKCNYGQAYFQEIQIRSADEPATLFFKCVRCGHNWREG